MTASPHPAVFGIYSSIRAVERAASALREAGFRHADISIVMRENGYSDGCSPDGRTESSEGAGSGTDSSVGGALGWLAGVGLLTVPGIGPFLAGGPIVFALAGAGAGCPAGGVTGALIDTGMPESEARRCEGRLKRGGILLSLEASDSDWTAWAKGVLERTGAESVSCIGGKPGELATAGRPLPRARAF